MAQKNDPSPGDFVNLVVKDLQNIEIDMSYNDIKEMGVDTFKTLIKKKTKDAAFKLLKSLQSKHSKIKNIKYDELRCQPSQVNSAQTLYIDFPFINSFHRFPFFNVAQENLG